VAGAPSFRIRAARPADAAAVREIALEAYAIYTPRIGRRPAPISADYGQLIERGEVWVADHGGHVLGFVVVRPQDGSLLLENVAVSPGHQRLGLGRGLIAFAEALARSLGLPAVELYTNAHMVENIGYYPRLGYVESGRRRQDGYNRVFFRKPV
jgi:ribosomal protein S18 acetylase RimI-like enzyme